jgi:hypothetical protein
MGRAERTDGKWDKRSGRRQERQRRYLGSTKVPALLLAGLSVGAVGGLRIASFGPDLCTYNKKVQVRTSSLSSLSPLCPCSSRANKISVSRLAYR